MQQATATGTPGDATAAAAALAKLQQVLKRQPAQTHASGALHAPAGQQHSESTQTPNSSSSGIGISSSNSSRGHSRAEQQLLQPQRPAVGPAAAAAAQEAQQQQQQSPPKQQRLLTWRSRNKAAAAAAAATHDSTYQHHQQQSLEAQTQQDVHQPALQGTAAASLQLQQQHAPPLEPSIVGGRAYLTSPVSFVAANTLTRRLAGSITAAFELHQHQLLFAVGPHPLGVAVKALATARRMLGENDSTRAELVNILMQPTLRGGRTPMRSQSYALDVTRVGVLPMQPGVAGRQVLTAQHSCSSAEGGAAEELSGEQQQQPPWADAKVVHITSSSNELAAARSLVENMPARGQTVLRAMGPYATETAVLALALARPLMQARHGQDLAAVVLWNEQQQRRTYRPGRETGLLLAVFRCEAGSFPPKVLLLPPSKRSSKRREFWQQRGRRTPAGQQQQQQQQQ
jgi:stage V sporulation protein SpoVS